MHRTTGIIIVGAFLTLVALLLASDRRPTVHAQRGIDPGGNILLTTRPSTSHLLQGGNGDVYLAINLEASVRLPRRRVPLNIGLVLDRSGSMSGQKLLHAKQAAARLVQKLRPGDRIAVVTFGSDVTVLVPSTEISSASAPAIVTAISTITDRGGTFLSGGLERGREEVRRHERSGTINRVILISDGEANEGQTTPHALAAMAQETLSQGVNLTTMGVGLDFNEEVMTAMAEHGGGHYYFVENADAMARLFAEELDTMARVVARTAQIELALAPGVDLVQVFGYPFLGNGPSYTIRVPDLFSGQERKVVCRLHVSTGSGGRVSLGTVSLGYVDPETGRKQGLDARAEITVTDDGSLVERSHDADVLAQVEQVHAASTMERAMKAYADGEVARSRDLIQAQILHTRSLNQRLKRKALDDVVGLMDHQLDGTRAAPSTPAGQSLVKRGRHEAYLLAK